MTILSDTEILARMSDDTLILDGSPDLAKECSYSFRPGKAFPSSKNEEAIDFTSSPESHLPIEPGQMVWIRTRERVKMPPDLAGFWWQTNTLSRRGLMLVNMSMVEPIYEGDLACLFVNFGDQIIDISSERPIAKMVFFKIDGNVAHPFESNQTRSKYDSKLRDLALNQPSSFLKIGDIADDLGRQKESILSSIEDKINTAINEMRLEKKALSQEISDELLNAKRQAVEDFKTDAPKAIWRSYGLAALALVLMGVAITFAGWVKDYAWEDEKALARLEAEKVVQDRLVVNGQAEDPTFDEIANRLDKIESELELRVVQ